MRQKQEEALVKYFSEATDSPISAVKEVVWSDSLFHYSIPLLSEKRQYVYILNASCSYCIAKAIECYNAYQMADGETPFVFLSRTKDTVLFNYYFEERVGCIPDCFISLDSIDVEDGIYTIKRGYLKNKSVWRYNNN